MADAPAQRPHIRFSCGICGQVTCIDPAIWPEGIASAEKRHAAFCDATLKREEVNHA